MAFAGAATIVEHGAGSGHTLYRSPSLALLLDRLQQPGKHQVLDLGAPSGPNVDFFSQLSCVLHIEDLHRSFQELDLPEPDDDNAEYREQALGTLFAHDASSRFDIIFGWDLFNYLDEVGITSIMKRLTNQCRPGTLLFLLASTQEWIPEIPGRFTLSFDGTLSCETTAPDTQTNPRYSPPALERMMPGFRLLHSFLLGDGMQDYLFAHT